MIDEEPDRYLNDRRTTLCMARDHLKKYFSTYFENKPLTLERLREMDGEPVWFENMSGGRWCIVYADYQCLMGKLFGVSFEEAERTGIAYRRKPEERRYD